MCFYHDGGCTEFWNDKTHKARKKHKCEECYYTILPGELYVRVVSFFEGEFDVYKSCRRCIYDRHRIQAHEWAEGCRGSESDPGTHILTETLYEMDMKQTEHEDVPGGFVPSYWIKENEVFFSPEAVSDRLVEHDLKWKERNKT